MMPPDITRYVARRFAVADQGQALALLAGAVLHDGSMPGPRLLRCAVVASAGSMERLRMEVETLRHDYRDVIVEGEYIPGQGLEVVKVRDLTEPVPDEE